MIHTKIKLAAASLLLVATGSAALLGQVAPGRPSLPGDRPVAAPTSASSKASPLTDEQVDLVMLERAWIDAVNRGDAAVVNRILADDFEGIDQEGKSFDKPSAVHNPLLGAFLTDSFAALEQLQARVLGDSAIVTGRYRFRDSSARGATTHVYLHRGGRWQCVGSHASWTTSVGCPAIGPTDERIPSAVREARTSLRLSEAKASVCNACHVVGPQGKIPIPPAPAPVRSRIDAAAPSGDTLQVVIDPSGTILIDGKAILPEKKALEDRFRTARDRDGRTKLVVFASPEHRNRMVDLLSTSALHAGFQNVRFLPPEAGN